MEVMRNQNDSASGVAAKARYLYIQQYSIIDSIHDLYICYCYNHQHALHMQSIDSYAY